MFKAKKIKELNAKILKDSSNIINKVKEMDIKILNGVGESMVEDSTNTAHDTTKEEYLSKLIVATVLAVSTSAGYPITCPTTVSDSIAKMAITKIADPIENKIGTDLEGLK